MDKIQKVLANEGVASRRQIERMITAGRIRVNDSIATQGQRIGTDDVIYIDNQRITVGASQQTKVLVYHKPTGEVCTRKDEANRRTIFASLPTLKVGRLISVGRLDINTSGLLLLTNNGELAHKLMHPSHHLTRVYHVRLKGPIEEKMITRLKNGIKLTDGFARFDEIKRLKTTKNNCWFQVKINIGRNRIVRRLWQSQNVLISRLIRVQFGPICLPKTLKPGQYCYLTTEQYQHLINH